MRNHIIQIFLLIATCMVVLSACEKREIPPIGEVESKLEGINGSFKLIEVKRTDKLACVNRPAELDISSFFIKSDVPTISFDSNAKTFTYSAGDSPALLPTEGSWTFINTTYPDRADEFPEQVGLTATGADELVLELLKPIRPSDLRLELELTRMSDGKAATGYKFVFERM